MRRRMWEEERKEAAPRGTVQGRYVVELATRRKFRGGDDREFGMPTPHACAGAEI